MITFKINLYGAADRGSLGALLRRGESGEGHEAI